MADPITIKISADGSGAITGIQGVDNALGGLGVGALIGISMTLVRIADALVK